jgi:hypothetical protein
MKRVSGYLTSDEMFFETQEEASLHEADVNTLANLSRAELGIMKLCELQDVQSERFMELLRIMKDQIRSYYNALEAREKVQRQLDQAVGEKPNGSGDGQAIDGKGEEDTASVLEQPTSGGEHVPSVGSGSRPTSVRDQRKGHGSRSR